MNERESLRAIAEVVRYLQKDAELAGADSVAMYLRLAANEADSLIQALELCSSSMGTRRRKLTSSE